MSGIAKCPVCGNNPVVWCRDDEERIRIMCCRFVVYTTLGWNQYAAAMDLARKLKELSQCDINPQPFHIEKQVEAAERRVLEVF